MKDVIFLLRDDAESRKITSPWRAYMSTKHRLNVLRGKSYVTGWYSTKKDKIYIHLTNLYKKYSDEKTFLNHFKDALAHETIHQFISKELKNIDPETAYMPASQEEVLDMMCIGHNIKSLDYVVVKK